jgi:hypothetical protein
VKCIDEQGYCNDVKVIFNRVASGFYTVNGYEYGCGYDDRILDGTARVSGGKVYISLTVVTSTSTATPFIGQRFYEITLSTQTGTGTWAWHYDGYHWGSVDVSFVSCPPAAVEGPFEADSTLVE